MTKQGNDVFSGTWYLYHWYPSKDDAAEERSEHQVTAHQQGDQVVFQSEVAKDGSYMLVRLNIDGPVASGSWHEKADPDGPFAGAMYSGAGELIIDEDAQCMTGLWAGAGMDHANGTRRIYTGRWELRRDKA